MHLILKCIEDYKLANVNYLQIINCAQNDLVICDSFLYTSDIIYGFGKNMSNDEIGLFPFDKFQLIYSTTLIDHDLYKTANKNQNTSDKPVVATPNFCHRVVKRSLKSPALCSICGEMMFGQKLEFTECKVCHHIFHLICWLNQKQVNMCRRSHKFRVVYSDSVCFEDEYDIAEWNTSQVIQWMCSINFFRLINLFETKKITGNHLKDLFRQSEDKIKHAPTGLFIWSFIKDQFYREALYDALNVLLSAQPIASPTLSSNDSVQSGSDGSTSLTNSNNTTDNTQLLLNSHQQSLANKVHKRYIFVNMQHYFRETTFMERICCSFCGNVILGLQKQGMHCINCRENFHKWCAAQCTIGICSAEEQDLSNNPDDVYIDDSSCPDLLNSSVFGIPLDEQISDEEGVPIFLKCCIGELETRSKTATINLSQIYEKSAETTDLIELRNKFAHPTFNEDGSLAHINHLSNEMLAKLIKQFCKELPQPILTTGLYHSLISVAQSDSNDTAALCHGLHVLLQYLPNANRAVLKYLSHHFTAICRSSSTRQSVQGTAVPTMIICTHDKIQNIAVSWSRVISQTLIWPSNVMLQDLAHVKARHELIVQLIFEYRLALCDFDEIFTHSNLNLVENRVPFISEPIESEVSQLSSVNSNETGNNEGTLSDSLLSSNVVSGGLTGLGTQNTCEVNDAIHLHEWYWSDVTKEEVNQFMAGLQDGYFMVRDSSDRALGGYTLTIRKDGENKLIRIMQNPQGLFGFQEPCQFRSVAQLVKYYRQHLLSEYNEQLNLTLQFPLSKNRLLSIASASNLANHESSSTFNNTSPNLLIRDSNLSRTSSMSSNSNVISINTNSVDFETQYTRIVGVHQQELSNLNNEELIDLLHKTLLEYKHNNDQVECDSTNLENKQHELDNVTNCLKAIDRIQSWYNSQSEHIMNIIQSNSNIKDHLQTNLQILNLKLNDCAKFINEKNKCREEYTNQINLLQKKLASDRPALKKLMRRQQVIIRQVKDRCGSDETFNCNDNVDIDELIARFKSILNSNPVYERKNWFYENLSKLESNTILQNAPHGTFLIRPSTDGVNYVLDVVVNQTIQRCRILKKPDGFRFVERDNPYPTLDDIVRTYHVRSLEVFNSVLKTKLLNPANAIRRYN